MCRLVDVCCGARFANMRTFNVFVLIPLVTVVYSIAVITHMVVFRDPAVFYRYARSWSRLLLRLAGVAVSVSYVGTRPSNAVTQRYIYAVNHASLFDIPVLLAYLPDNVRIMYKRELERIPIFGWCLKLSPFIAVDRANAREANDAIDQTAQNIRNGASVLIFPEGTRSDDGELGSFKRGFATLAVRSGTSICPVALIGTSRILPARTKRVRGGTVRMVVMPPIAVQHNTDRAEEQRIVVDVRAAILEQLVLHHDH